MLMGEILLWAIRIVVGGALLVGGSLVLHRLITGGDVHPADRDKPLYLQRVRMGGWRKSWGIRWGGWVGLFVTLAPASSVAIYGLWKTWSG